MKLNRILTASVLGLSLITTSSAFACEHGSNNSSSGESHWSFFDWCHHFGESHHDCDHDQNSGSGHDCNHGGNNGGGSGSTGHQTGGGGTTTPPGGGPKG